MVVKKKESRLVKDVSVSLHFKEMIDRAKARQKIDLADMTEFYIVDLLTRFLLSTNLFPEKDKRSGEEPLAIQLYKAIQEKSIEEKILILKKIGDFALYISGFFSECLGKKAVDLDYYISMGEGAYGAITELSKRKATKAIVTQIFAELSVKFKKIVDLIAEVSELSSITRDSDLVRIYEKWMKTKSPRLKEKLIEKGLLPIFRKIGNEEN